MSAQCSYCGAAVFHEGRSSTQYQCRTTTYDDGPASRSQVCMLTKELAEARATLSRVEAERDGLRAVLSLTHSQLDRAWRSGTLPADVIPSETARRIVAALTTTEGEKP